MKPHGIVLFLAAIIPRAALFAQGLPVELKPGPELKIQAVREQSAISPAMDGSIAWGGAGVSVPAVRLDYSVERGTGPMESFRIPLPEPVIIEDGMDVYFSAVLSLEASDSKGAVLAAGPVVEYGSGEPPARRAFAAGIFHFAAEGAETGKPVAALTRDGKVTPVSGEGREGAPLELRPGVPVRILIRLGNFKTQGYAMPEMAVAVQQRAEEPVTWSVVNPGGNMSQIRAIPAVEIQIRPPSAAYNEMRSATGLAGALRLALDEAGVK